MDVEDYVDLVERYREKADYTSLMAYTSSWGEANPNGGKEVVDDYLEKTRGEVKETEQLLRKVLGALKLEVLPASQRGLEAKYNRGQSDNECKPRYDQESVVVYLSLHSK
eukprot:g10250.t1 g10250   contig4:1518729-1519058(-)